MTLRRLRNAEYERAEELAAPSGIPLDVCPTCQSRLEIIDEGTYGREHGQYKHHGELHDCDCERQMDLRRHYLVSGIGDQYARLDWADFDTDPEMKAAVDLYLDNWKSMRANGVGIEFSSPNLGVGKTFGATHIGKELIKRGVKVFFVQFEDVVSALTDEAEDADLVKRQLREATVLILDEVAEPWTTRQGQLFAAKLEQVVRSRTNDNLVVIMTTNLTPEKLRRIYPRVYSLLEAKQIRVEMKGSDARLTKIANRTFNMALDGEVAPIT